MDPTHIDLAKRCLWLVRALLTGAREAFMDMRLTPLEKTEKPISIVAEVARLMKMTVPQLRIRHMELFGEPASSCHKGYMARCIAWRLQAELVEKSGDLDKKKEFYQNWISQFGNYPEMKVEGQKRL